VWSVGSGAASPVSLPLLGREDVGAGTPVPEEVRKPDLGLPLQPVDVDVTEVLPVLSHLYVGAVGRGLRATLNIGEYA